MPKKPELKRSAWQETIERVESEERPARKAVRKAGRAAVFVLNTKKSEEAAGFVIDYWASASPNPKTFKDATPVSFSIEDLDLYSLDADRELLAILYAPGSHEGSGSIPPSIEEIVLQKLSALGRFFIDSTEKPAVLEGKPRVPWTFKLTLLEQPETYKLQGWFHRQSNGADEMRTVDEATCVLPSGWIVFNDGIARLDVKEDWRWIQELRNNPDVEIPKEDGQRFVEAISRDPHFPQIDLPQGLEWRRVSGEPAAVAVFTPEEKDGKTTGDFVLRVEFDYDGRRVSPSQSGEKSTKRSISFEDRKLHEIARLHLASDPDFPDQYKVERERFATVLNALFSEGWNVFAKEGRVREAKRYRMAVKTSGDWFDLDGRAEFENGTATLPALVKTQKAGDALIQLKEGEWGALPQEWLARYAPLNEFNNKPDKTDKPIRFSRSQGVLLDAWLAEEKNLEADDDFIEFREKLHALSDYELVDPPKTFKASLRNYQRVGLSWLTCLSNIGFGGILADDMGLGKTVQMLAFFEKRRVDEKPTQPSIIVVPKSLVSNWLEEAAKFAPKLKVLQYHGAKRAALFSKFKSHDLIVTTYNTLRLDIEKIKDFQFDCAVLDEAQSIKNAKSLVTKSCKLVKARWKLALTGTPIENDLSDLFSIIDYVNPGFMKKKLQDKFLREYENPEVLESLSKALMPFILRRTKDQVLKELPKKTEQTLFCELSPQEQAIYDNLKAQYRASISDAIKKSGLAKSKIQVLEALLRLRQAACHPGLIDKKKKNAKSAKLELLVEELKEIIRGGSKALVFSQFVSLLEIVKHRLEAEKISFEYLDGETQDRQERVQRFQKDPKLKVFLISLKAGGTGLNLTKASYVFLLDPWWNPAVEAQAMDRTHRIGQVEKVFAYRLVAKGTVEEKILALQGNKRKLADSIISADSSLLKSLKADDLKLLLS